MSRKLTRQRKRQVRLSHHRRPRNFYFTINYSAPSNPKFNDLMEKWAVLVSKHGPPVPVGMTEADIRNFYDKAPADQPSTSPVG